MRRFGTAVLLGFLTGLAVSLLAVLPKLQRAVDEFHEAAHHLNEATQRLESMFVPKP